jgi:hypothetical protein
MKMKKITFGISTLFIALYAFASPKADGYSFCADTELNPPAKYVAIKDATTYFDAFADGYIEGAKIKGKKIKKGTIVKAYSIGKNCSGEGKTIFMNIDDVSFTGVKFSDFKKVD